MSFTFNADEIYKMAEQIERNGAKYYRRAAEFAKDTETKEAFLNLASMEDDHENTFAAMRAKLTDEERKEITYDPEDLGGRYLKALADGRVFDMSKDPASLLTGEESISDVLHTALGMEKASIAFYTTMKMYVSDAMGRDKIENIITEEISHITIINLLINTWEEE